MTRDAQIGERFRLLREKHGWPQQEAADAAGIRRERWARYEAGSEPKAAALAAMVAAGIDVLYLLTGESNKSHFVLTDGDRVLLDNYHAAPPQVREGVKTTLGAFAPSADGAASDRPAAKRGKAA